MQAPLMFTVIMPAWEGEACWDCLVRSKFTRRHIHLLPAEHGFLEGAQHNRPTQYRAASAGTSVMFLQNAAAARKWPVAEEHERLLRRAFAPKRNAADESAAQQRSCGVGGGQDVLQAGDFAHPAPVQQGAKRKRQASNSQLAELHSAKPHEDGVAHGCAHVHCDADAPAAASDDSLELNALPANGQRQSEGQSTVKEHQVVAPSRPTGRKKAKHRGASSTGKFASDVASAQVLDSVLADYADGSGAGHKAQSHFKPSRSFKGSRLRSGNHGQGHEVHADQSCKAGEAQAEAAGVVTFGSSKSQRRAHRQHKRRRKAPQRQALQPQK